MSDLSDASDNDFDDSDNDYYNYNDADFELDLPKELYRHDAEHFKFKECNQEEVEGAINESVEDLCKIVDLPPAISQILLYKKSWDVKKVENLIKTDLFKLLSDVNILPSPGSVISSTDSRAVQLAVQTAQRLSSNNSTYRPLLKLKSPCCSESLCEICFTSPYQDSTSVLSSQTLFISEPVLREDNLHGMSCGHRFCLDCWRFYLKVQIEEGSLDSYIQCMATDCSVRVMDDFLLKVLNGSALKDRYLNFSFRRMIESHPKLRFCVGRGCNVVICALEEPKARRIKCEKCSIEYCFKCGCEYHAPTDCETIKRWLIKCRDDSETANYMAANTKDCPQCNVCIEKNGGCNHMQCSKCQYEFCWVCLGPWNTHHSQFYYCSRCPDPEDTQDDSSKRQNARESLKRYLFYFQRWENHERSLRLEQEQKHRIQGRIEEKVLSREGTWIDWQYLLAAADTLQRCRYTLKYTYPYAYYYTKKRKELFEYQQGLLEAEVEGLSWKIEHAEINDRAGLQNKIDVCEKHRLTLLEEFLQN